MNASSAQRPQRRGFTLTELLVVIAIIVLLVGILLTALNQVQKKGKQTRSLATMQSFANACEAFFQEHGFYPGVVPEEVLIFTAESNGQGAAAISGAENALFHLMGGFTRQIDDPLGYAAASGVEFSFAQPSGGNFLVKFDVNKLGEGPVINGKAFAPYFTPSARELQPVEGQFNEDASYPLPDVVDAWGNPIVLVRRARPIGPIAKPSGNTPAQFSLAGAAPFLNSTELGNLGRNQHESSILGQLVTASGDPPRPPGPYPLDDDRILGNFTRAVKHPALGGQPRGALVLMGAGPDGIYLSKNDGAGSPGAGNEVIQINTPQISPTIVGEYDDVLIFSGS